MLSREAWVSEKAATSFSKLVWASLKQKLGSFSRASECGYVDMKLHR